MLLPFAWAILSLSTPLLPAQEEDSPPPARELVEQTVDALEVTLRSGDDGAKIRVLDDAREVPDAAVVKLVVRALKDRSRDVQAAAIQSLRWLDHPDALAALHKTYKQNRPIQKDDELVAALLKAIGQHGDESSISILADNPFKTPSYPAVRARILGLGRVRSVKAVEALVDLMKTSAPRRIDGYMDDFRLSLIVLTGTDQGPSSSTWSRWWTANKKKLEITPDEPELPRPMRKTWVLYWGLDSDYGRRTRREDRGEDR